MIRKFKTLGTVFVAVFAMSAVVASAAQAAEFNWGSGTTELTAEAAAEGGNQVFKTTAGSVECNTVTGSVAISGAGPASELETSSITYTDSSKEADHCKGPLGTSPKIEMNGCQYRFHASGTVDVVCPTGASIVINAGSLCTVKVGAQTGLGPVTYTNRGTSPQTVNIKANVGNEGGKGISYTHSGLCGNGSGTTGTYTGNVVVKGHDSGGNQTSVSYE